MKKITDLEPALIWGYFNDILQIPRPSKKEGQILKYLIDFANERGLEYNQDSAGNIVIKKNGSTGYENAPTVILQSHVDMVCEKNSNVVHDFEKDPIKAYIDGEWLRANGTTLGADNGIGIAAELAVLADDSLKHPPIECLFTVDEETGLTGAMRLEKDFLDGKTLINLDSEDDGEIFMGCAGGIDTLINIPLVYKDASPGKSEALEITLSGLTGGHSGDDINKGLANSNKLLVRGLWNLNKSYAIELANFKGGNLRNAIPREAIAIIRLAKEDVETVTQYLTAFAETIKSEYSITEPNIALQISPVSLPEKVLEKTSQDKFLCSVYSALNGVIAMSQSVPGLVETSTNLASIDFCENNTALVVTSQRSSVESAKLDLSDKIRAHFSMVGAEVKNTDHYPGWTPNTNSKVLNIAKQAYSDLFNQTPTIRAIHAGLECGLFLEKYPSLDMVSIGPTIRGAHSPDERMEINTVDKFWAHLTCILERLK